MSVTISIRFLTGRAHLHPWQTHHSEGRVEWPPSQWRLLRALVAVAGRGLTSLPHFDDEPSPRSELKAAVEGITSRKVRGVPQEARNKLSFSRVNQTLTLKEPLSPAEAEAWKAANPEPSFVAGIEKLQKLAAAPDPVAMGDVDSDEIPLSRLAGLLHVLSATPTIWLPKTSGGHTRQYFPIHSGGMVKTTGSAVFDTFATLGKDQPLLFHWPQIQLDDQQQAGLKLLLGRMTYFGRAESWCCAEAHTCPPEEIKAEGIGEILLGQTHWECVCIEDQGSPQGKHEYRDYLLERRLTPATNLKSEVAELLPRTKTRDGKKRKTAEAESLQALLQMETPELLVLRCLLRESGQDIRDGLERPIGTDWIHYAVPREIYDVPRRKQRLHARGTESVNLVRYALNTATINRPVLPGLADTLLIADRFRSAAMALCSKPDRAVSGHERDGSPCQDHRHAYWWPVDEDNDGFIDHVMVWAPGGFEQRDIDAMRRLTRLRQRGGRPDLLVTPVFVGRETEYRPWRDTLNSDGAKEFVSATPYFCPVHLSHGRKKSGRMRSLQAEVMKSLRLQGTIEADDEVHEIKEIVFDFAPGDLVEVVGSVDSHKATEPIPPRQFFPVIDVPSEYPPLPRPSLVADFRYRGAALKDADAGYCFGNSVGLLVDHGSRFIRALSFCRRRRAHKVLGHGRMLQITFCEPRQRRPFAIGSQCHFGLGLFVPASDEMRDRHALNCESAVSSRLA